jgi:hypothetical protein
MPCSRITVGWTWTGSTEMVKLTQDDSRFARFAMEDFGTTDVPIALRRHARHLAAQLGITPKQALDRLRADSGRDNDRRAAPQPQRRIANDAVRNKTQASGHSPDPRKAPLATPKTPKGIISRLQRVAIASGRKWVKTNCIACSAPIFVHADWREPPVMCKKCREKRRSRMQRARKQNFSPPSSRSKAKMRRWWPVSGGLPSLGKRR